LPDALVRVGAVVNPRLREVAPDLGYAKRTSNEKARRLLGWSPRSVEDAIVSAAESMVRKGLGSPRPSSGRPARRRLR
jgi:nucleoside-diphosphate-sugar epimerase